MKSILTPAEMRTFERALMQSGIDEIELMHRAAEGIFAAASPWCGKVGILCGGGNNAGDGYALALMLKEIGARPILLRASEKLTEASAHYYEKCRSLAIEELTPSEIDFLSDADRLVDCLFGIGFHGVLSAPYSDIADWCNAHAIPVIAADIPSGLNALTGAVEGSADSGVIKASMTVAVGAYKPGHFFGLAPDLCGTLSLAPLCGEDLSGTLENNSPVSLIEATDIAPLFAPRPHSSHKGNYGTTLLLGGCDEYGGAPKLATLAAASLASLRSGCGIARLAVPETLVHAVAPYLLESTLCPMPQAEGKLTFDRTALDRAFNGVRSAAVGMGWGRSDEYADILGYMLPRFDISTVIDADGLNTLAQAVGLLDCKRHSPIVLTPHPKEFERLSGIAMAQVLADPIGCARAFAEVHRCIVLLKGSSTVITDGQKVYLTNRGCGGMATAGSGDVLSGVLASLLAWSPLEPLLTVAAGAYLSGLAGEIAEGRVGSVSMVASDTVAALPEASLKIASLL